MRPKDFKGGRYWMSHEQFERILKGGRALMRDEEEFRIACQYRLADGYGPLRFLVRASSVSRTLSYAVRTMHLVSRISRYELVEVQRDHIHTIYRTSRPESRLMCISRQAQIEAFATLWALPQARVEESACVAKGDPHCEYHIRWYQQPRWIPAMIGAACGLAMAVGAGLAGLSVGAAIVLLPLLGATLGHLFETRRVYRRNVDYGEESNESLRQLARDYAEAVQEITALNQRHRHWNRLLEEQLTERRNQMEQAIERLQELIRERDIKARNYSHDLRSPLILFQNARWMLRQCLDPEKPEGEEVLRDLESAANRMSRLLQEFMQTAYSGPQELVALKTVELDIPPLVERLRRRLQAQVLGKDIRVSVFACREAPERIETDQLLFDRVVDNLLTNAARYTETGSIVVELAGSPATLTIKVSDTGPGIGPDALEMVFRPGETVHGEKRDGSYGLGLPIVVRLLDQIGGRLEVMSRRSMGTTFWAHFPTCLPTNTAEDNSGKTAESLDNIVSRVVTIRLANDKKGPFLRNP